MNNNKFLDYWLNPGNFTSGQEHRFNVVWLLFFAIGIIFIGIGLRDPWPADEPRFAQIAREMVETGQWFFPMRGGEIYPDKPPVFMWSIALFYWLSGSITLSFLLPSAITSVVTSLLVYDLGRRLWSTQVGWYAALLLLFTVQFVLQAKSAQIDAMVCCWITIACYGLARHLLLGGNWPWYFIACFFMGIGIITKGVGFLPIFMLIPYLIVRIKSPIEHEITGGLRWLAGILILLFAISLWFIPMLYLVDQSHNVVFEQYRDNILFKQTGERYANSWHHVSPFWYYLVAVIPAFWLPLSVLLPWLATPWYQAVKQSDRRIILLLGWVALVVLFFSLSPGKRGVYLLPALPMLSLACAPYLTRVLTLKWPKLLLWSLVLLASVLAIVVGVAGLVEIKATVKLVEKFKVQPWYYFLIIGLLGAIATWVGHKTNKVSSWLVFIPGVWILYSTWGYLLLNPIKTPRNVLSTASTLVPPDAELAMIDMREQFILFSPLPFTHFGYHTSDEDAYKAAWLWQGQQPNRFLLTHTQMKHACYDVENALPVGRAHGNDWLLLSADTRQQHCEAAPMKVRSYSYHPRSKQ